MLLFAAARRCGGCPGGLPERPMGADCKSVAKATEVRILYPPPQGKRSPSPAETAVRGFSRWSHWVSLGMARSHWSCRIRVGDQAGGARRGSRRRLPCRGACSGPAMRTLVEGLKQWGTGGDWAGLGRERGGPAMSTNHAAHREGCPASAGPIWSFRVDRHAAGVDPRVFPADSSDDGASMTPSSSVIFRSGQPQHGTPLRCFQHSVRERPLHAPGQPAWTDT